VIYRKHGVVVRWENGTRIRVEEEGVATEAGGLFACEPSESSSLPLPPFEPVDLDAVAAAVREAALAVTLERAVILDGCASHAYGDRSWTDTARRVHVSLTHGRMRVMLDLASFEVAEVAEVADALARLDEREALPAGRIRLAPGVTAAMLPVLAGAPTEGVRVIQSAGGVDGYGTPIVETDSGWPNAWRPSYRLAPRRMPMNLRIDAPREVIDVSLPRAVALLAVQQDRTFRVLLDDGTRSRVATLRIDRVLAASGVGNWYPYGAGSFGAEMML
jgi:hypothetical protein